MTTPQVSISRAGSPGAPGAPGVVQSVNGHSAADITLDAADVGAQAAGAAAGGDLAGTYPAPEVAAVNGVPVAVSAYTAAPSSPVLNQLWYDQTNSLLKQWNGGGWQPAGQTGPTRGYRPPGIAYLDMPYSGQSSGGPTLTTSGTGSTGNTADTSDFVLGTQACYVTSNGAGAQTKITAAFGASPLNMAGKSLVLWVKLVNLAHILSGYPRVFLGDTGLTNVYEWKFGSTAGQPWNLDSEWMRITLPFGAAATVGSPNRASLGNLIIQFFDDNTGNPVTIHLGGIATMAEPAAAFPHGVCSIAFDDGYLSQFTTAKPLMDALGYRATAYLITETLWNHGSGNFNSYMTLADAQALETWSGWEIGSHAFTAANHNAGYVSIGDQAALADMQAAKAYLISQGFRAPEQFAYPLGVYDAGTIQGVQSVFGSGRTISVCGGFPDETFPPAQLPRLRSTPVSEVSGITIPAGFLAGAAGNHEWVIYTFHDIQASASGSLQLSTAHFTTFLADIQASGIEVMPVSEVLRQLDEQVVIGVTAADTSVVVGGTTTAPTLATGTLDVIAADHPPAAAVGMNSQKITGLASGSVNSDAANIGQVALLTGAVFTGSVSVDSVALSSPQPADLGYLAWSFDPVALAGTSGAVLGTGGTAGAGVLQLIKLPLYGQSVSSTGVRLLLSAVGATLTSTENYAYLYNSSGTFIAATADQTTAWTTAGNAGKTLDANWSGGPFTVSGTFCWVALAYNGTTGPSFARSANITAAMANGRLANATSRYGSILSSVTTATPGNFTPSSVSQLACEFWAAIF